jgi:hypothetical protein
MNASIDIRPITSKGQGMRKSLENQNLGRVPSPTNPGEFLSQGRTRRVRALNYLAARWLLRSSAISRRLSPDFSVTAITVSPVRSASA